MNFILVLEFENMYEFPTKLEMEGIHALMVGWPWIVRTKLEQSLILIHFFPMTTNSRWDPMPFMMGGQSAEVIWDIQARNDVEVVIPIQLHYRCPRSLITKSRVLE